MRDRLSLLFAMGVGMLFAFAGVVLAQPAGSDAGTDLSSLDAGDPIPNRYIVVLEEDVASPASVARDLAGRIDFETTYVYDDALNGFAAEIPAGDLSAVRANPRVDFVAQDRVVEATRQGIPTGIKRIDAPQSSTAAGDGSGKVKADIAILDSGIYKQHKDLNISGGRNCRGRDKKAWSDGDGHGTHVAGTAAARDNSIGVVGVAPGARLWAVKVLGNDGSGSFSSVICGIDWVTGKNTDGDATNDIEAANMSLGATVSGSDDGNCGWTGSDAAAAMHQAICDSVVAGAFYAVAAGNASKDFATDVPAAYDEVLTATAMADFDGKPGGEALSTCGSNVDDTFANFSNYTTVGSSDEDHTIAAPGACIRSTWNNGGYKTLSGTSMASPHVAGTAALCIVNGNCPTGDPQATLDQLRTDAQQQAGTDPTVPDYYGYIGDPNTAGIVNYYGFLEYAGGY